MTSLRDRTVFTKEHGVFKTSRDGRLLHFDAPERGGLQICDNLPPGKPIPVVEAQSLIDGRRVVALMGKKRLHVCFVHLITGDREVIEIPMASPPVQVVVAHQQLLVIHSQRVTMHEILHGEQAAEVALPGRVERCYGDLLLVRSEWHRVSIDGMRPCLETIDQEHVMETSRMEEYGLKLMGALRKHFRGVSFSGTKVVLHTKRTNQQLVVGYHEATQTLCFRPIQTDLEPELFRPIEGPEGSRLELREVCWPDGSRMVLDPRGLLHFGSPARDAGEFTLILSDRGPLSAWVSGSGSVGDPYYFVEVPTLAPQALDKRMSHFVLHLTGKPC